MRLADKKLYLLIISAGLIVGLGVSFFLTDQQSYCGELGQNITERGNVSGTTTCYPPGVIEVNASERVENSSELKCACKNIFNGRERIFPVFESN